MTENSFFALPSTGEISQSNKLRQIGQINGRNYALKQGIVEIERKKNRGAYAPKQEKVEKERKERRKAYAPKQRKWGTERMRSQICGKAEPSPLLLGKK